jgi:hypothetical protein
LANVKNSEKSEFFAAVDEGSKKAIWCAVATIDYDLTQCGSTEPEDPNFLPVKVMPSRVELSEMFGSVNKRVWRS